MAGMGKGSSLEVQGEAEKHIRGTEYHKAEVLVKTPAMSYVKKRAMSRGWVREERLERWLSC